MDRFVNPFEQPGKWYKANLHAHTTTSDGALSAADRIAQYRRAGYDVLALTDHNLTNDVEHLHSKGMLVISGAEYHPKCRGSVDAYHLVALGVPHGFRLRGAGSANAYIKQVNAVGGLVILAHASWCGFQFPAVRNLRGLAGVEVYNTVCDIAARGSSESEWVYMLDHDLALPAVAVDDTHSADGDDLFGGVTWLKMSKPTSENVLKAIRTGCCYASSGPRIHDFRVAGGKVLLRCGPARSIHIAGPMPGRGRGRFARDGKRITRFAIDVPDWRYVRGVVVDEKGRRAWTNPIVL